MIAGRAPAAQLGLVSNIELHGALNQGKLGSLEFPL